MQSLPALVICVVVLPFSLILWASNSTLTFFTYDPSRNNDVYWISPIRWLLATLIPVAISWWGLKRQSLSRSGAALGLVVGFILTLSNYSFLASLMAFFVSSSKVTKFRSIQKKKLEEDFKEGGQRNWVQVVCNGGVAAELALLYMMDAGCGERAINFVNDYRASWLNLAVLSSLACCNGDTWASELATVISKKDPILITSGRRVPRGTNGGVTLYGLLFSFLGGLVVGAAHYLTLLYTVDTAELAIAPPQWPLVLWGAIAGLFGSVVDSLLGATVQYSGLDSKTGHVVEHPGPGISHISGTRLMDNHSVNLVSTLITALFLPKIAMSFWP